MTGERPAPPPAAAPPRHLVIVSHVVHYAYDGRLYAYGPYMREIDLWADLFPVVTIAAPCRRAPPPADALACGRANVRIAPQRETGGRTLGAKLRQLVAVPALVAGLTAVLQRADAIHVRCPGNLGLLGALLAPLRPVPRVAKYAGQWNGYPGEPVTVRLQRALLRSRWWGAPVTVYGTWPGQPAHVVPFFTSVLTPEQVQRAARAAAAPKPSLRRVLYVGRLAPGKNVDVLLAAIAQLHAAGGDVAATLVGDGPERSVLEAAASRLGIDRVVRFAGAVPFDEVLAFYETHDILVLASEAEGWPKAIAEAMAFGLVCIGSDRGFVREMLGAGRGVLVAPGDAAALAAALRRVHEHPEDYAATRARAAAWGQRHSLADLARELRVLLEARWQVRLEAAPRAPVIEPAVR